MDDVAEMSSIAKGTLYLYFKSKRQIYLGVLKQDIGTLREATECAMNAALTPKAKIFAFVQSRFEFCELHRDFFRIYNSDISAILIASHPSQKDLRDFYYEQAGKLADVIAEAIRQGEVRPVPVQATAFAIYDVTRATIARRLLGKGETTAAEHGSAADDASFILDLIWQGLGEKAAEHA